MIVKSVVGMNGEMLTNAYNIPNIHVIFPSAPCHFSSSQQLARQCSTTEGQGVPSDEFQSPNYQTT